MTRAEIIYNLSGRIDDATLDRITHYYPVLICPTCNDRGFYRLDNAEYECDCELQKLLQKHYYAANIGKEYHDICLYHFEGEDAPNVVPKVQDYLENYEANSHFGLGLTFSGQNFGTGKTFAMCCVLKELVKRGHRVYFITFEELINVWGSSYHNDESRRILEDKLKTAEVLGLDEVRSDPRNREGFLANGLDTVIRHRTSNLLPTHITTNMTPQEEEKEFGKAYSLLGARNRRIEFESRDNRNGLVRQRNYELAMKNERRPVC